MTLSSKIRRITRTSLAVILVLVTVELIARIAYTLYKDTEGSATGGRQAYYRGIRLSPEVGWEPEPGFAGPMLPLPNTIREYDSDRFVIDDAVKISDHTKPRVVFIGDSSTFGWENATSTTFVHLIRQRIPAINTVNLGMIGYTSFQGYRRFIQDGLQLNPDIVVVSFNYNDRRYVLDNEHTDSTALFQRMHKQYRFQKLAAAFDYSYLFRSLRSVIRKFGEVVADRRSPANNRGVTIDNLRPRVSPEDYRANLRNIIALARGKGIDVILVVLRDNPAQTEYLRKGIDFLEKGRHDDAIDALTTALREKNAFSFLGQAYLEKAYRNSGRTEEANRLLVLKDPFISVFGGDPMCLDTEYNEIVRKVAEEYGVEVVEAGELLHQSSSNYLDFCHPDENGHQKIATLLSDNISKILRKRGLLPPT